MAIRVSSSLLRRPLKCSSTTSRNVSTLYLVLLLVTLVATGPLPVDSLSTQQQQQQPQQDKYSPVAVEQSLAEQMILEPPLQVGKPSPYDLELGGNDIILPVDQSVLEADRAKLLSKIMTLLEAKRLPPHIVSKFGPRALSLLSASTAASSSSSSSGLQHKRQIRYQQCYFNPISCFK